MNEVYVIRIGDGNEYKLQFTTERSGLISFFCDFIHAIPSMSKRREGVTVQQYRSELFTRMFEHYVSKHRMEGIHNKVVVVEGVAEPYYFHIISRSEHQLLADMIAEGHHRDFDK